MKTPFQKILGIIILTSIVWAVDYTPNRVLVKLAPGVSKQEFSAILDGSKYEVEKVLVRRLKIVSVKIIDSNISAAEALSAMRTNPWVEKAQLDHKLKQRDTFPDDGNFSGLWNLHNTGQSGGLIDADIDAPEAWDITTGGITPLGDSIVVAVVDGGCDLSHNDLVPNLWVNRNEIPGNNIDDDNNGYVDDINGWDAYNSDGSVPSNSHGTHVSGTIGAVGNNDLQVTGINWNIKIMSIAGSTSSTSVALEAYGYVLDQRVFYDSTGGQLGAFVVATNSSFGIDNADCNSGTYILWNEMYDSLGAAGILNAAATMNSNSNVDVTGDVPTGCESDYVIAVTNTTRNDVKNSGAAYGATMIDLGAPGTAVLSTVPGNGTSTMSGTSMASPHVAGAVGFLHAAMTDGFAAYYYNNPGDGALLIKDFILAGTDSLSSLNGITVSGGRLNINNTAQFLQTFMASDSLDPNPVTELTASTTNWYEVRLDWTDPTELFGGDPISPFFIDITRNNEFLISLPQDIESYVDGSLIGGLVTEYELVTRLMINDSTSTPVNISAVVVGDAFVPGDVNHDGNVNVVDVVRLLHFTLGYDTPTDMDILTADVDSNGLLEINDLLYIVDIILGRN